MRSAGAPGRVPLQRQAVMLHDAQHPLGVDGGLVLGPQLPVQKSRYTAIAIGRR